MSSDRPEIVIVRRRGPIEEEHHGGAWKIAFADFMTAMMAFFLVLWIISATDKNTKTIIARYFNPVKVEEPARSQKGIRAPDPNMREPDKDSSGAPNADKPGLDQSKTAGKSPAEAIEATPKDAKSSHQAKAAQSDPAHPTPTMAEEELFSDPMASLDRISGGPPPRPPGDPASAPPEGAGEQDQSAGDSYRDPFRPLGADNTISAATDSGGPAGEPREEPRETPSESPRDPASRSLENRDPTPQQRAAKQEVAIAASSVPEAKLPPEPAPTPAQLQASRAQDAKALLPDAARARAAALLAQLKKRLGPETPSTPGPQLDVQATDEGILISLTDRENYSMFAVGSAEPQRRVVHMMDAVATSLQALPGAIVVRGHTDARPFRSAHYDNWRLSSARAQMAYYMLNRAGIPDKRFERIEGFADHRLKDPAKPLAAENRRIEILLREAKP
jgi:chemotaxis protein MotB